MTQLGEDNGNPLHYSCLENPMDGGGWWAAAHAVLKSRTRLSDFTFTFHFHALEKEMATHSSILAWRIPGTEEPGGLPSMGSHRVGHYWSDLAAVAAWPSYLTPEHIPKESYNSKRYMHPMFTAALFATAKTWKQPRCPSTEEQTKEDMVHLYNGLLVSH